MKLQFEKYSWDPWGNGFDFSQPARQAYKAPQESPKEKMGSWFKGQLENWFKGKQVAENHNMTKKLNSLTPEQRGRLDSYKESSQKIKEWSAEREQLRKDYEHPANWNKKEEIGATITSYNKAIAEQKEIQAKAISGIQNSGNKTLKELAGEAAKQAGRYDFEAKLQKMDAKELKEAAAKMEKDAGGKPLSKEDQTKKDAMEKTAADKEKGAEAKADKGAKNGRLEQIDKRLGELHKAKPQNHQEQAARIREIKTLRAEKEGIIKERDNTFENVKKHEEKPVDVNDRQKAGHERAATLEKAAVARKEQGPSSENSASVHKGPSSNHGSSPAQAPSRKEDTALDRAIARRETQGKAYGNNVSSAAKPTNAQAESPEKGERVPTAAEKQSGPAPAGKPAEAERGKVSSNTQDFALSPAANRYRASLGKGAATPPAQPKAAEIKNAPSNSNSAASRYAASIGREAQKTNQQPASDVKSGPSATNKPKLGR